MQKLVEFVAIYKNEELKMINDTLKQHKFFIRRTQWHRQDYRLGRFKCEAVGHLISL
jgi:hypothetical protein